MRHLALALLALFLLRADMFPDASNAKLPQAINNLTKDTGTYFAPAYGACTWDETHDIGPCANAAILAAGAAGGGTVVLPAGQLGLATTILMPASGSNVELRGAGGGGSFLRCGTSLKWIGAPGGVMLQAGDDAGTLVGAGIRALCLDGDLKAGIALKLISLNRAHAEGIFIYNPTQHGILTAITASNAAAFGDSSFKDIKVTVNSGAANGITWGPELTLNRDIHETTWQDIAVDVFDGIAFDCHSSDTNTVSRARFNATGAGKAAVFRGSTGGLLNWCRKNFFYNTMFGLQASANLVVEGTDTPGVVTASQGNIIFGNKVGDGEPSPVIGAGATLFGWDTLGRRIPGSSPWMQNSYPPIVSYTADRTLDFNDCGTNINNRTGGTVTYTLPPATGNYCTYTFTRWNATTMTVKAAGTDVISGPNNLSTSAGGTIATSTIYATVTLQDTNTGRWLVTEGNGPWLTDGGQPVLTSMLGGYTIATLPAAPGTGARAYITNQTGACPAPGASPAAGGALVCPVFFNGAAWVGG